jgi:hypothetical protein
VRELHCQGNQRLFVQPGRAGGSGGPRHRGSAGALLQVSGQGRAQAVGRGGPEGSRGGGKRPTSARKRLEGEQATVELAIAAILDNLTPRTRDLAEGRLGTLRRQRQELERRASELERLALEERQVQDSVGEVGKFLAGLEFTLRHGIGEERMAALLRCVRGVAVCKAGGNALVDLAAVVGGASEHTTVRLEC